MTRHTHTSIRLSMQMVIAISAISICALTTAPAHAAYKATVTNIVGKMIVERGGATLTAATGTAIEGADMLTTGPDASVTMTLVDGSEIHLGPNARLIVDAPDGDDDTSTTLFLVVGDLWARVARPTGAGAPFHIATVSAVIAVHAQELGVAVSLDATTLVAVETGKAEVVSPDGPRVTLTGGEQTEIPLNASGAALTTSSFAGGQRILQQWREATTTAFPGRARLVVLKLKERTDATLAGAKRDDKSAERLFTETLKLSDGWRRARDTGNASLTRRVASRIRVNIGDIQARVRTIKHFDNRLRGYYELVHAITMRVVMQRELFPAADRPALATYYAEVERLAEGIRAYHDTRRHWVRERLPILEALTEEIREREALTVAPSAPDKKSIWQRLKPN